MAIQNTKPNFEVSKTANMYDHKKDEMLMRVHKAYYNHIKKTSKMKLEQQIEAVKMLRDRNRRLLLKAIDNLGTAEQIGNITQTILNLNEQIKLLQDGSVQETTNAANS